MSFSKEDLAALAGLVGQVVDAKLATTETEATPKASASTSRKAATSGRKSNDSPLRVDASGEASEWSVGKPVEGDAFLVIAATSKTRFRAGARVDCYVDGKRSMNATIPRNVLERLGEDGVIPALLDAIDAVNKRAAIGPHAPVQAVAAAA